MVGTVSLPQLQTGEKKVALHHLAWHQYQQILTALPQARAARITYSLGTLEISMPLEDHEQANQLIGLFIRILVVELGLRIKSMGSTTLSREDLGRGAEPDNAYYIQNQATVAGRSVNLKNDPPPDLVVEIDITHTDLDKTRLYAAMGVPEFWHFDGRIWRIYLLRDGSYAEVDSSPTFQLIEKADLYKFMDQARQDEVEAEISFRGWIRNKMMNNAS